MRIFFNLLTPFGFGGGPFVVYYLDHHEVPAGKGSSIVLTRMMVVSVLVFAGAVVILLVLTYPHGVIKLISWIGRLLHRLKVVKEPDRFRRRVIHEGSVARRSFRRYFTHHPVDFSLGALGMGSVYCSEVTMLFLVIRSLGHLSPVGTGLAMSALFYMALSYMPTPGSSGLGEGIGPLRGPRAEPHGRHRGHPVASLLQLREQPHRCCVRLTPLRSRLQIDADDRG